MSNTTNWSYGLSDGAAAGEGLSKEQACKAAQRTANEQLRTWAAWEAGEGGELIEFEPEIEEVTCEGDNARETSTGVERGIDVDFTLTINGEEYEGEVTLLPHEDGSRGYGAWGEPNHWVDGRTITRIRDLASDDYTTVLDAIEAATAPVATDFAEGRG
jgi:hypothetical protein